MGIEYIPVLRAFTDLPFNVGKKLLIDYLRGIDSNPSIKRNRLDKRRTFGYFELYQPQEVEEIIDLLLKHKLVEVTTIEGTHYRVLTRTKKGDYELVDPKMAEALNKQPASMRTFTTNITDEERQCFTALEPYLSYYNDSQKKAIISNAQNILCVAGAGTGKTTVLTKRIDFLMRYRSVKPRRILAITFTRKAREEMQNRVDSDKVAIHTFNSFCEKYLSTFEDVIYKQKTAVISFKDKIRLLNHVLQKQNISMDYVLNNYFSKTKLKQGKDKLSMIFLNDCFSVIDLCKLENVPFDELHQQEYGFMMPICKEMHDTMQKRGLRDYTDQLLDCINFFRSYPSYVPSFDHILVDEFQDVNSQQMELLDILAPSNLFCVGDPRQSIYGWRGSKIKYILEFPERYEDSEVISLTDNYRSRERIVNAINSAIKPMKLPDLKSTRNGGTTSMKKFDTQEEEFDFVIKTLLKKECPRNQIFILARTNKQLKDLSDYLKQRNIRHLHKSEDGNEIPSPDQVVLSTVHSIKGLEAEVVFAIGCSFLNYPCKASDHPILDAIKVEDYDKDEEERRLLYVALSRAHKELHVTYTGQKTRFITPGVEKLLK
ncbi:MAG: UvrD-helicase domain-containing protein [Candidatus Woesearchaeota archaeon]